MAKVYYPIRSFGDFIITASVIRQHFSELIPILLPDYMREIFDAIYGEKYFQIVGKVDFSNQPAFFEMYKVKDFKNFKRLIRDFKTLSRSIGHDEYLLDYRSRRIRFISARFRWPVDNINIYEAKKQFLLHNGLIRVAAEDLVPKQISRIEKIIVFPDSRVEDKQLSRTLLTELENSFPGCSLFVAYFGKAKKGESNTIYYQNFPELMQLLDDADLVISAESLPYHLAYFVNKPHFVIYNISRHYKFSFMTPYMLRHDASAIFDGSNSQMVVDKIEGFITNFNLLP